MEALTKLLFPLLNTPRNYGEILKKLAAFAFYETYLITFLLRSNSRIESFLTSIESWGPIGKVLAVMPKLGALNVSGLVIALFIAILTHTFQFHDRISDILRLRKRFDCVHILMPLARLVGSPISKEKAAMIAKNRDSLMHSVFYRYASSRDESPLVDKHDIEHALNAWSWFWVFVEAVFYFAIGGVIALWFSSITLGIVLLSMCFTCLVLAALQRMRLPRFSRPQIEAIARDAAARQNVKEQFDAL